MGVYTYNPDTGEMVLVDDGKADVSWEPAPAKKDPVITYEDRWDAKKGIWTEIKYVDGVFKSVIDRPWAKHPAANSVHAKDCLCRKCVVAGPTEEKKLYDDTDSGSTPKPWTGRQYPKSTTYYPSANHVYQGGNYHYKPDALYDKVDRKKWPSTWRWLLTFHFSPDYLKDTRYRYESSITVNGNPYTGVGYGGYD